VNAIRLGDGATAEGNEVRGNGLGIGLIGPASLGGSVIANRVYQTGTAPAISVDGPTLVSRNIVSANGVNCPACAQITGRSLGDNL
jgi:hypothetical protein